MGYGLRMCDHIRTLVMPIAYRTHNGAYGKANKIQVASLPLGKSTIQVSINLLNFNFYPSLNSYNSSFSPARDLSFSHTVISTWQ